MRSLREPALSSSTKLKRMRERARTEGLEPPDTQTGLPSAPISFTCDAGWKTSDFPQNSRTWFFCFREGKKQKRTSDSDLEHIEWDVVFRTQIHSRMQACGSRTLHGPTSEQSLTTKRGTRAETQPCHNTSVHGMPPATTKTVRLNARNAPQIFVLRTGRRPQANSNT